MRGIPFMPVDIYHIESKYYMELILNHRWIARTHYVSNYISEHYLAVF